MTLARFVDDRIVQRLGGPTVIGLGGLGAAGGFAIAGILVGPAVIGLTRTR